MLCLIVVVDASRKTGQVSKGRLSDTFHVHEILLVAWHTTIELCVGSSPFSNEVMRRAASISFFSLLLLEGIAAVFVLFSQKNAEARFSSDSL